MQSEPIEFIKTAMADEMRELADNVSTAQREIIEQIKAHLRDGDYRLKQTICPCGEDSFQRLTQSDRFGLPLSYVMCSSCGIIRQQGCLDEASLQHFYQNYFRKLYRSSRVVSDSFFRRQYRRSYTHIALFQKHLPVKVIERVLDYGCSAGGYVKAFEDMGFSASGVDYDEEYLAFGKKNYGVDLRFGGLEQVEGETFDLITLNHVLEHIAAPHFFFEDLKKVQHNNSYVYVGVPGVDSFFLRKPDPLSAQFHLAHIYVFSRDNLTMMLSKAGYHPVYIDRQINSIFKKGRSTAVHDSGNDSEAVLQFFYRWYRYPAFRAWQTLSRSWPHRFSHTIDKSKGKALARKNL